MSLLFLFLCRESVTERQRKTERDAFRVSRGCRSEGAPVAWLLLERFRCTLFGLRGYLFAFVCFNFALPTSSSGRWFAGAFVVFPELRLVPPLRFSFGECETRSNPGVFCRRRGCYRCTWRASGGLRSPADRVAYFQAGEDRK